jgi:hypothetical protein
MTAEELKAKLDEFSWDEQMEFEMSERDEQTASAMMKEIESRLAALGKELTPGLLDILEQDSGYLVWALRLSPHVPGDVAARRGQRYLRHPDSVVRYWAELLQRVENMNG